MQKHVEIDEPEEVEQDFEMAIVGMGVGDTDDTVVAVDALAVNEEDQDEEAEAADDAGLDAAADKPEDGEGETT
jgi:hypothetical protein